MKKNIFLAAAACCICICASAFDVKKEKKPIVTTKMEQSLTNVLGNNTNVEWRHLKNNTIEASLEVDGRQVRAFFDTDGEFICTTAQVDKDSLPVKLRLAIDKKFPGVSISAIVLTNAAEETNYYFQSADAKGVKVWKGTTNGRIEFVQKL